MTKYTTYNQKKVAYSTFGQGFPLVFVHGFCEDRSMWLDFITAFSNYKIILVDVGGFGESEQPEEATISTMAAQVEAVLKAEQAEKCIFIGHSMGGYIAAAFAEKYPNYLQGLTMFHTHPFADVASKKRVRDKGIRFIQKYGVASFVTPLIPKLFGGNQSQELESTVSELIEKAKKYTPEAIIGGLLAMKNRPDHSPILTNIDCPVQFIIGKLDGAVTWEQSLKQTTLPNIAMIQILNEVGHMGMFEATEATQKMVLGFVEFCSS